MYIEIDSVILYMNRNRQIHWRYKLNSTMENGRNLESVGCVESCDGASVRQCRRRRVGEVGVEMELPEVDSPARQGRDYSRRMEE